MVTELAPASYRTQAIGLYWSVRSLAIMLAPLVGGVLWLLAGPQLLLWTASLMGLAAAVLFCVRFRGSRPGPAAPALATNEVHAP
jgi:predicted MFS family arabinose efflux permease